MIEDGDIHRFANQRQPTRDALVHRARPWVAARMIVREYQPFAAVPRRVGNNVADRQVRAVGVAVMKATIQHNPMCGTSRKTLEILRESGADVTVNEYLKNPLGRDELKRLYERAGISPREGMPVETPTQLRSQAAHARHLADGMP